MPMIPKDLIEQLRIALLELGDAPQDLTDPVRDKLGTQAAMALDEVLAVSYQIIEATEQCDQEALSA